MRFKKMNENEFIIFACFTRSYDESHIKSERIHLISSVVCSSYEYDLYDIENEQGILRKFIDEMKCRSTYNIVTVLSDLDNNYNKNKINLFSLITDRVKDNIKSQYSAEFYSGDCVRLINISLDNFLGLLDYDGKELDFNEDFLTSFFGKKDSKEKELDLIFQDSVFIFRNIPWNIIVFLFKIRGIDISGGSSPKRHMLTTVDATLKEFLDLLYNYNTNFINKNILYESFKDKNRYLSSLINLDNYNDILEFNIEIDNMLLTQLKWKDIGKFIEEFYEKKNNFNLDIYNQFKFKLYILTFKNICFYWLIENITDNCKKIIKKGQKLEKELNKLNLDISILEKNLSSAFNNEVKELKEKISELNNYKSINEDKIEKNWLELNEELKKIEEEIKDKSIIDLYNMIINLDKFKKIADRTSFKKKFARKSNSDRFNLLYKGFKRGYSTFSNYRCNLDSDDF
jgi:hypothetical protein